VIVPAIWQAELVLKLFNMVDDDKKSRDEPDSVQVLEIHFGRR
jgi:hypothetical protein